MASLKSSGCQAAKEVKAIASVFLLLLALVPPADLKNHERKKTHVWIQPCRSTDVSYVCCNPSLSYKYSLYKDKMSQVGRGRSREADHEELEVVGRNNRPSPKPLRKLRLMSTIANSHFHSILDTLSADLCNKVLGYKETLEAEINYRWLPENPTLWYKRNVKCLDKKTKVKQILPKFHEGIQRYLASIEKLREPHWSKLLNVDCRYQREKRLEEISGRLAQLLCEVDKCMRDMGIARGPGLGAREGRLIFRSPWDVTYAHLLEAVILSKYGDFIKDWNRIIRQVVGKKGSAQCQLNKQDSLP